MYSFKFRKFEYFIKYASGRQCDQGVHFRVKSESETLLSSSQMIESSFFETKNTIIQRTVANVSACAYCDAKTRVLLAGKIIKEQTLF